ncbi:MAG: DUF4350 domain-containing protein [Asgard group archaeon]|nr:DUF4350 domain-containing protein [Asgard group archaeon]
MIRINTIFSAKKKSLLLVLMMILALNSFMFYFDSTTITSTKAAVTKTVLFEESHYPVTAINDTNENSLSGAFADFATMLTNNSYTVETLDVGQTIDQATLSQCNILVIVCSFTNYTTQEIDEIYNWVLSGGSIFVITEWALFGNSMTDLVNRFGFDYPIEEGIRDSDDYVGNSLQFCLNDTNIKEHEITSGITRVEVYAGTGFTTTPSGTTNLLVTDDDDTNTWDDSGDFANNIPMLCALEGYSIDKGKLVISSDFNIWSSSDDADSDGTVDFFDSDNEVLGLNIINWLNTPYTKKLSIEFAFPLVFVTLGIVLIFVRKTRK